MEKERNNRITDSEWQIMELIWQECCEICKEEGNIPSDAEREGCITNNIDATQKEAHAADSVGATQPAIMAQLGGKWNKNTVHTFLKRLCDKGYLTIAEGSSPHRYIPLVSRADCEREERQSFLERVYQGSAERMMAAFIRDGGIDKEEAAKLRSMLEELR